MSIVYQKLSKKDLPRFIEMRINQLKEEGAKEDLDLRPTLNDYYDRHMTTAHLCHGWRWIMVKL